MHCSGWQICFNIILFTSKTITLNIFSKLTPNSVDDKILAGNIFSDISDHLANSIVVRTNTYGLKGNQKRQQKKIRKYGEKNQNEMVAMLRKTYEKTRGAIHFTSDFAVFEAPFSVRFAVFEGHSQCASDFALF